MLTTLAVFNFYFIYISTAIAEKSSIKTNALVICKQNFANEEECKKLIENN